MPNEMLQVTDEIMVLPTSLFRQKDLLCTMAY